MLGEEQKPPRYLFAEGIIPPRTLRVLLFVVKRLIHAIKGVRYGVVETARSHRGQVSDDRWSNPRQSAAGFRVVGHNAAFPLHWRESRRLNVDAAMSV